MKLSLIVARKDRERTRTNSIEKTRPKEGKPLAQGYKAG